MQRFPNIESNKMIGTCSLLDPRFKLYPFTSEISKKIIKEHVKQLAIAEYSKQRAEENNERETQELQIPTEL